MFKFLVYFCSMALSFSAYGLQTQDQNLREIARLQKQNLILSQAVQSSERQYQIIRSGIIGQRGAAIIFMTVGGMAAGSVIPLLTGLGISAMQATTFVGGAVGSWSSIIAFYKGLAEQGIISQEEFQHLQNVEKKLQLLGGENPQMNPFEIADYKIKVFQTAGQAIKNIYSNRIETLQRQENFWNASVVMTNSRDQIFAHLQLWQIEISLNQQELSLRYDLQRALNAKI